MKKYLWVWVLLFVALIASLSYMLFGNKSSEETQKRYAQLQSRSDLKVATFAGGCFWCMEGPYQETGGVEEAIAGFAGGQEVDPSYEQVVSGSTSHRESVQVFYDPKKISYEELLKIYWLQIDPTDAGGQFADRGKQYSTAIFYHDEEQETLAEKSKSERNKSGKYDKEIVTEVLPFSSFYPAEDYHQDYYIKQADSYKRYEILSGRQKYKEEIKKKLGI
jgi:methionine-S-sulfoxide reductase